MYLQMAISLRTGQVKTATIIVNISTKATGTKKNSFICFLLMPQPTECGVRVNSYLVVIRLFDVYIAGVTVYSIY